MNNKHKLSLNLLVGEENLPEEEKRAEWAIRLGFLRQMDSRALWYNRSRYFVNRVVVVLNHKKLSNVYTKQ